METTRITVTIDGQRYEALVALRWSVDGVLQQLHRNERTGEHVWLDVPRQEVTTSEGLERRGERNANDDD